jgi:acyl carrier protein phosphodiesterase
VANGARNELEKLLATDLCTSSEQQFFENVLANMQSREDLGSQFAQHIHDIENKYHVNPHLNFAKLWPELSYLLPNE